MKMEERLNQHEDRIDRNDVSIGRFQEAMIEWGIRSLRTTRILDDLRPMSTTCRPTSENLAETPNSPSGYGSPLQSTWISTSETSRRPSLHACPNQEARQT